MDTLLSLVVLWGAIYFIVKIGPHLLNRDRKSNTKHWSNDLKSQYNEIERARKDYNENVVPDLKKKFNMDQIIEGERELVKEEEKEEVYEMKTVNIIVNFIDGTTKEYPVCIVDSDGDEHNTSESIEISENILSIHDAYLEGASKVFISMDRIKEIIAPNYGEE